MLQENDSVINSRTVLKSMGTGATMVVGSGATKTAIATKEVEDIEPIVGDELKDLGHSKLREDDVQALLPDNLTDADVQLVGSRRMTGVETEFGDGCECGTSNPCIRP